MAFSPETKDQMLRAAFGGRLLLGLLVGKEGDRVEDLAEETDRGYERQAVMMGGVHPASELTNANEVRFPPYAAGSKATVRGWALYDELGTEKTRELLQKAKDFDRGERPLLAPGDLVVGISD